VASSEFIRKDEYIEYAIGSRLINKLIQFSNDDTNSNDELISLAHDIKNVAISSSVNLFATEQIIQICNGILSKGKNEFKILNLLNSLKSQFGERLSTQSEKNFNIYSINSTELERILSNLITNSFEANSSKVDITTMANGFNFRLILRDNGTGIPDNILENVRYGGLSTKENGHGVGLTSCLKKIESIGGNLEIESSSHGTTISIQLPYFTDHTRSPIVILDDDKYQKIIWLKKIDPKNLHFYTNFNDLLKSIQDIPKSSFFFVDKNLKGEDGLEILRSLSNKGFENLFLNFCEQIQLNDKPFIIANLSKQF